MGKCNSYKSLKLFLCHTSAVASSELAVINGTGETGLSATGEPRTRDPRIS